MKETLKDFYKEIKRQERIKLEQRNDYTDLILLDYKEDDLDSDMRCFFNILKGRIRILNHSRAYIKKVIVRYFDDGLARVDIVYINYFPCDCEESLGYYLSQPVSFKGFREYLDRHSEILKFYFKFIITENTIEFIFN